MFSRGAQPDPTLQVPLARLTGSFPFPDCVEHHLLLALGTRGQIRYY